MTSLIQTFKNKLRAAPSKDEAAAPNAPARGKDQGPKIQVEEKFAYQDGRYIHLMEGRTEGPLFLVFHGGGFFAGESMNNLALAEALAKYGQAALVDYRTYTRDGTLIDASVSDAIDVGAYMRSAFEDRDLVIVGMSAGAVLASWVARILKDRVSLLFLLSPVTDLGPEGFRNVMVPAQGRRDLSPIEFLHEITAPIIGMHATFDPVVNISQVRAFFKKAMKSGQAARLVEVDSDRHDFHRVSHFHVQVVTELLDVLVRRKLTDPYPNFEERLKELLEADLEEA